MEVRCDRSNGGNSLGGEDRAFGSGDSTLSTSNNDGIVRRGHIKGLLTGEVEATENTNKNKTAKHKKVKAMTLIPC